MSASRREISSRGKRFIQRTVGLGLLIVGLVIVALPVIFDLLAGEPISFGIAAYLAIGIGVIYCAAGAFLGKLPFALTKFAVLFLTLPCVVIVIEGAGRVVGFDFAQSKTNWEKTPIFYRQPTEPIGKAFFRRPGPDRWKGKVLTTQLKLLGVENKNAYQNESEIIVTYDEDGFRNPQGLKEWDLLFLGDSFTELGHLSHGELFSSIVGETLDLAVKNLGVSDTGILSHGCYFREFGDCESVENVMLVFFEGNDCEDTLREYLAVQKVENGAERVLRDLDGRRQTSFIRAMTSVFRQAERDVTNAAFVHGETRRELTVSYSPPDWQDISPRGRSAINAGLREYARLARQRDVTPWLIYMPCKRRVLHGHLQFSENALDRLVEWTPTNLPTWMESACRENKIAFVDLTSQLIEQTEAGVLVFNHVYDSHLNSLGSSIAAEVIIGAIADNAENVQQTPRSSR